MFAPFRMPAWCLCATVVVATGALSPAWSQEPTLGPVKQAYDDFMKQYDSNLKNLDEMIAAENETKGPCAAMLQQIRSRNGDVKPSVDALAQRVARLIEEVQPIMDLKQEIEKQKQELEKQKKEVSALEVNRQALQNEVAKLQNAQGDAQKVLNGLKQGQRDAVGKWLLDHYGQQTSKGQTIKSGSDTIVVFNTLFGTLVVAAPTKLAAREPGRTTVRFMPGLFHGDIFAEKIHMGPVATLPKVPQGLEFIPGKVDDGRKVYDFQMREQDAVSIDGKEAITWNWESNATNAFQGADFDIVMASRLDAPDGKNLRTSTAKLPVKIPLDAGKSAWEKYGSIISPVAAAVLTLATTLGCGFLWRRLDERKATAKEERKKREAEREQKAAEDERIRKSIVRPHE